MFGDIYGDRMIVHCGKVHDYLGMYLDFSSPKVLKIGMIKYIKKIHEEFPEKIKSSAVTPASEHLFDVREGNKDKLLPEEQAQAFHRTTAQLFLCAHVHGRIFEQQYRFYVLGANNLMRMTGVI